MATVEDTYTWAAVESELKTWLGVSGSAEDTQLQLWLSAVTQLADDYIGPAYTDDDGDDLPIPDRVKVGVFEGIRILRDNTRDQARGVGLRSVKTGDNTETYDSGTSDVDLHTVRKAVRGYWWYEKTNVFI